jgi:hypothetical protein
MLFGKVIESVTRQPEMRDEITSIQWLGFRAHRGDILLRPGRRLHRLLPLGPMQRGAPSTRMSMPIASSSWLITPNVGLMIWTLVVFAISLFILIKAVFPRIGEALDSAPRRSTSRSTPPSALAVEADELLAEYRERLREARQEAEEIVERARQAAESHEREARAKPRRGASRCWSRRAGTSRPRPAACSTRSAGGRRPHGAWPPRR